MNLKQIQSILMDVLEEQIPSSEVNLWPAVQANLVAGDRLPTRQGAKVNITEPRRMQRLGIAIPLALALLAVLVATPQGRSFAQTVLEFFTRSEGTALPVEISEVELTEPDLTSPTAEPPAPLISVAEAEAQVGYQVAELPFVPEGFNFLGVRLYGSYVSMDYMTPGYGHLIITQSQDGYYQSDWDQVPDEVVVPVVIGDLEAELVQGRFVMVPGQATGSWNPDPAFTRLRWVDNGLWVEMALSGDAYQYLGQEGLISLAESLAIQP